jgi:hypothetical protein
VVEPSAPRRGFRLVLDALGIRIDAGAGFGGLSQQRKLAAETTRQILNESHADIIWRQALFFVVRRRDTLERSSRSAWIQSSRPPAPSTAPRDS